MLADEINFVYWGSNNLILDKIKNFLEKLGKNCEKITIKIIFITF